jgi:hypothetical protein
MNELNGKQLDLCRMHTPLCDIMSRHGSDKGPNPVRGEWHNYTQVYHELFKERVEDTLTVFELGLGTNNLSIRSNMGINGVPGASIRGWKEYFTNSQIFGADIDRNILFTEDRIQTVYCDQTNPSVIRHMWTHLPDMDIIIEDGLHVFEANVTFFENSIHKLKQKGIYVIEDVETNNVLRFNAKFEEWRTAFPDLSFTVRMLRHPVNTHDNNLVIIRRN